MRLARITIKNFRRLECADIFLEPATYLIGQNNYGKSSAVRAIELLLTQSSPDPQDFRIDQSECACNEIELTGYFSEIDTEVANARGFKGRVVSGEYCYRKTYQIASRNKPKVECKEYPYTIQSEFADVKTIADLESKGVDRQRLEESFSDDFTQKLKKGWERNLLDVVAEFDTNAEPKWVENPGGIPANVLSKLPRIVHVPPLTKEDDVGEGDSKKSTLISEALGILFEDILAGDPLTVKLQSELKELETHMSPQTEGSLINVLCHDVNEIIGSVFPGCGIKVEPSLQDLSAVLKPRYEITMFSNVSTDVRHQGTGLLRTAVFSMLRYHAHLHEQKGLETRPLLVAFEEPELYLHPSAANLLRDTIYALGRSDQIVCTTHSPWMIDLSQDLQSLTKMVLTCTGSISATNYGVSEKLAGLQEDDKCRVKMLQMFDDELSRVFFSENVVIVEGDSELVAMKATVGLLPYELQKRVLSRTQVVKARGKASIISLVKYLKALSITPFVIHDRDSGNANAEVFNEPIFVAVGDQGRLAVLEECLEHALGFEPPSSEKPYRTYVVTNAWKQFSDIPDQWRDAFSKAVEIELGEIVAVIAA